MPIRPVLLLVLAVAAAASAAAPDTANTLETLRSYAPCFKGQAVWPCLKERALALFNKALLTDSIELAPGFVVARDEDSDDQHLDASDELDLPAEPHARENKLDQLLWSRALSFFKTRTVSYNLEGSGYDGRLFKKKIKQYVLPFLLMKLSLGFLATKALLIGKLAMALTVFVLIRDFLEERKKSTHETYEVFAKHPEHDYHYDGSSPVHAFAQAQTQVQPLQAQPHPSGFYPTKGRSIVRPPTAPAVDVNDQQFDNSQFAQMMAYRGHPGAA